MKYRDLHPDSQRRIGAYISPNPAHASTTEQTNGWERIGVELGFKNDQLQIYKSGLVPGYSLLSDWGRSSDSTVEVLTSVCAYLERADVVDFIDNELEREENDCVQFAFNFENGTPPQHHFALAELQKRLPDMFDNISPNQIDHDQISLGSPNDQSDPKLTDLVENYTGKKLNINVHLPPRKTSFRKKRHSGRIKAWHPCLVDFVKHLRSSSPRKWDHLHTELKTGNQQSRENNSPNDKLSTISLNVESKSRYMQKPTGLNLNQTSMSTTKKAESFSIQACQSTQTEIKPQGFCQITCWVLPVCALLIILGVILYHFTQVGSRAVNDHKLKTLLQRLNISIKNKDESKVYQEGEKDIIKAGRGAFLVITAAVILLGIPGNILTILAIISRRNLQNTATIFIANLAFSDLWCLIGLTGQFLNVFRQQDILSPIGMCSVIGFFFVSGSILSPLNLAIIAISRCVLVFNQRVYHRLYNRHASALIIFLTWLLSIAVTIWALSRTDQIGFNSTTLFCGITKKANDIFVLIYALFLGVPTVCIVICYVVILFKLNQRKELFNSETLQQRQLTKMIQFIIVIYAVTVIPYALIVKLQSKESKLLWLRQITGSLVMVNFGVNALVYGFFNRQMRKAYFEIVRGHICERAPQKTSTWSVLSTKVTQLTTRSADYTDIED